MDQPTSYVYLIAAPELGPGRVKIGVTQHHPKIRLSHLQTGSPVRLTLLYFVEGNDATERLLHAYFGSYRQHGEWFEFGNVDPVGALNDAMRLIRKAAEPYDPYRRFPVRTPVQVEDAQQRYQDRRNAIITRLLIHGSLSKGQMAEACGIPVGSVGRIRNRMQSEGVILITPRKPGEPHLVTLNLNHPDVVALLPASIT
jgi:hypothetical protein